MTTLEIFLTIFLLTVLITQGIFDYLRAKLIKELKQRNEHLENYLMIQRTERVTGVIMGVMRTMGFEPKEFSKLDMLRHEMHLAEQSENFERAAEIKTQIEALEKKVDNNNPDLL